MSAALAGLALLLVPGPAAGLRLRHLFVAARAPSSSRLRAKPKPGDLGLAATWDLLAACLRAGLPVATAISVVIEGETRPEAEALRATARLLALGASPAEAWAPARAGPATAELARAAQRTARSGSALATVAEELAAQLRTSMADKAEARAQRAGVLIAGPLALCFLPAFLCLGVVPVVIGLASRLSIF
ncbi:type II secretion system F family protein [Amycolatopsis alkalitolerans]|uniref:Type II secretion system F family protein n=1 Tax=Amycolatopsis alkalitolerans TaxID=2547244 RepID=A0A5C4LS24_9PSEU|nr:type II secretion system F family protein [Amycolatopsis alkalitolerans]TNC21062.1 type II secretion system F family protein [Amycolatopsis alkalitolerans]